MNNVVVVSGERWRDSALRTRLHSPQTPSHPGWHGTLSRAPFAAQQVLLYFKWITNKIHCFEQAIFIGTQMGFYMPLSPTERSSFCSLHKKSSPSLAQNHWLKFYLLQSRSSLRLHMFLLWHRLIWNTEPSAKHPILASDVSRTESMQDFFCPRCHVSVLAARNCIATSMHVCIQSLICSAANLQFHIKGRLWSSKMP